MNSLSASVAKPSLFSSFVAITKARLAISVVFSTVAGFLLGVEEWNAGCWVTILLLATGGYCMVGASNVFNQVIEKDLDALMDRTKSRPLPSGMISKQTALILGFVLTLVGLVILYIINPKTAMFGAISIFMYVSLYTPLKTVTPLSVFVGAFPGAIPFMLGWVAATGHFGIEAGTLFIIQFFWQFPHFWAIGWFLYEDYEKAGFYMLPTGKRDKKTALQTILYTFWTIAASLIPVFGFTGRLHLSVVAAVIVALLGFWMLFYAVKLYKEMDAKAARKLMIVSVSYISLLQIIYVIDKFIH
ncbi:heme o synthase [Flavobacterium sp. NRK F10]|uniref:Protoheme IX farnesyltransferase n=1 Tax=Flavobacterium sediminis TaxID=2201181 RepID=A0A2U8QV27_9FLAO|nr:MULTISPECIES: heme o synthase [Flavobacterium]AWM13983.1 protoheme IX farnesyltransferase [Flavobacterium sediminis]MCO6175156.1 heme o synthase [Flavobacterium sp. NRK F10]